MAAKKNRCELKSPICSGELMKRYVGKEKGDPEFNACYACLIFMKLKKSVRTIGAAT